MLDCNRRILLAVQPSVLEGALVKLLSVNFSGEIVHSGRTGLKALEGNFDAAVISFPLPVEVRADVVITLPDARGSAGLGTVRRAGILDEVTISGAEAVVELLHDYLAHP